MPKFEVQLSETVLYTVEVEAENESEARKSAEEAWAQSADPTHDFRGAGQGITAISVDLTGDEEAEPERKTFTPTMGADVRCYVQFDAIEAVDEEDARRQVMEILENAGPVVQAWSWKPEDVQGGISIQLHNEDTGEAGEFVAVPDWNGPDYSTLEAQNETLKRWLGCMINRLRDNIEHLGETEVTELELATIALAEIKEKANA